MIKNNDGDFLFEGLDEAIEKALTKQYDKGIAKAAQNAEKTLSEKKIKVREPLEVEYIVKPHLITRKSGDKEIQKQAEDIFGGLMSAYESSLNYFIGSKAKRPRKAFTRFIQQYVGAQEMKIDIPVEITEKFNEITGRDDEKHILEEYKQEYAKYAKYVQSEVAKTIDWLNQQKVAAEEAKKAIKEAQKQASLSNKGVEGKSSVLSSEDNIEKAKLQLKDVVELVKEYRSLLIKKNPEDSELVRMREILDTLDNGKTLTGITDIIRLPNLDDTIDDLKHVEQISERIFKIYSSPGRNIPGVNQVPLSSNTTTPSVAETVEETADKIDEANEEIEASNEEVEQSEEELTQETVENRKKSSKAAKEQADEIVKANQQIIESNKEAVQSAKKSDINTNIKNSDDTLNTQSSTVNINNEASAADKVAHKMEQAAKSKKKFAKANQEVEESANESTDVINDEANAINGISNLKSMPDLLKWMQNIQQGFDSHPISILTKLDEASLQAELRKMAPDVASQWNEQFGTNITPNDIIRAWNQTRREYQKMLSDWDEAIHLNEKFNAKRSAKAEATSIKQQVKQKFMDSAISQEELRSKESFQNQVQKEEYEVLNKLIDQKISLMKEEAKASGKLKNELTLQINAYEEVIAEQHRNITSQGLTDKKRELDILHKISKAENEIYLQSQKNAQNDFSKQQSHVYAELNRLIKEKYEWLNKEISATGEAKKTIAQYVAEKNKLIDNKRTFISNNNLLDLERENKLQAKILEAEDKLRLKRAESKNSSLESATQQNLEAAAAYDKLVLKGKEYYQLLAKLKADNIDLTAKESRRLEELTREFAEASNGTGKYARALDELNNTLGSIESNTKYDIARARAIPDAAQSYLDYLKKDLDKTADKFVNGTANKRALKFVEEYKNTITQFDSALNELRTMQQKGKSIVDSSELGKVAELQNKLVELEKTLRRMKNNKEYTVGDTETALKRIADIHKTLDKNTNMPKSLKESFEALSKKYELLIETGGSQKELEALNVELAQLQANLQASGRTGNSFFTSVKKRLRGLTTEFFAMYLSLQDLLQLGRQGFEIIKEYDDTYTEMIKVSNDGTRAIKDFQKESFELADSIGTTASQIQNSTADWLRLGEAIDEAKESAQATSILFNVSEFESIDEATESLVAMSQAYKDLEKMDIVDIMNNVGNKFSISTDGLARALQNSASALTTAGNDINEAVALITAGEQYCLNI